MDLTRIARWQPELDRLTEYLGEGTLTHLPVERHDGQWQALDADGICPRNVAKLKRITRVRKGSAKSLATAEEGS